MSQIFNNFLFFRSHFFSFFCVTHSPCSRHRIVDFFHSQFPLSLRSSYICIPVILTSMNELSPSVSSHFCCYWLALFSMFSLILFLFACLFVFFSYICIIISHTLSRSHTPINLLFPFLKLSNELLLIFTLELDVGRTDRQTELERVVLVQITLMA